MPCDRPCPIYLSPVNLHFLRIRIRFSVGGDFFRAEDRKMTIENRRNISFSISSFLLIKRTSRSMVDRFFGPIKLYIRRGRLINVINMYPFNSLPFLVRKYHLGWADGCQATGHASSKVIDHLLASSTHYPRFTPSSLKETIPPSAYSNS